MFTYARHKPESTLLYKIIDEYYPLFLSHLIEQGRLLPEYVKNEFEEYLRCGILRYGFFRLRCDDCREEHLVAFSCKKRGFCPSCCAKRMTESAAHMADTVFSNLPIRQWVLSVPHPLRFLFASQPVVMTRVLRIVYRAINHFLIKKVGLKHKEGLTGAVTLIQRFGSALNLNVHFHMLFIDGVYQVCDEKKLKFIPFKEFATLDLQQLTYRISQRIANYLERAGYIERDVENSYLSGNLLTEDEMQIHRSHSVNYRIAMGSMICRYITRPPLATTRLSLTAQGNICYELKTPYRNGTTHVIFEPLDFISKLAALVPLPRVNLTRFHGAFAPNCKLRKAIVKGPKEVRSPVATDQTSIEKRRAMNWAQRLKRAFNIDMSICTKCNGSMRIIACIEDPIVIDKILDCIANKETSYNRKPLPFLTRGPPFAMLI